MKNVYLSAILFVGALLTPSLIFSQGSGKSYDFNSSYINVPTSASLNPGTITLEAWIKADSWATNIWENVIISKDGWATGDQGYTLRAGANGSLSFNIGDGVPGWHEVATGPLMQTGKWYHVAGTYDGTIMRLYLNGNQVASMSYTGAISATTYNLTIGKMSYAAGGNRYFDGEIDEVRIWNVAVPQTSLRTYMCKKLTTSHPEYANLVGHWNMDASGPVTDQSPLANHGTAVGATQANSGAPIGDESVFTYTASPNLTMTNGLIDSVNVTTNATLTALHIYRVNSAPLVNSTSSFIDSSDQSHYYGVYAEAATSFLYTMKYYYAGNPFYAGTESYGVLSGRVSGTLSWAATTSTQNTVNHTFTSTWNTRREFRLAYDCPIVFVNATSSLSFCEGGSATIHDAGPATIRQWYDASGPIAGQTGPTLVTSTSGTYYLIANGGGCAVTSPSFVVTAFTKPTAQFGNLDPSYCANEPTIAITNGSPSTGGTYAGPGISGTTFSPNVAGIGTHSLTYSVVDGNNCSDVDTVSVQVLGAPAIPVVTQSVLDLCTAPVAGLTYQWFENGNLITGATSNCYTASSNGNYTVVATNGDGCSETSSIYILDDLSINENEFEKGIRIFPNPTNDKLNITSSMEIFPLQIEMYDSQGRKIIDQMMGASNLQLDLSSFEQGLYFVHISNAGQRKIERVVLK